MSHLGLLNISVFANFAAFLVITFICGGEKRKGWAPLMAMSLSGLGALTSLILLFLRFSSEEALVWSMTWLQWENGSLAMGYYLDKLSLLMLTAVCVISFMVQTYSAWYMKKDPGIRRYFGTITFFSWAMIFFVVSVDLFGGYIFWELLGLASYLLIGFWHEKPEPRRAAIKAFIMTRFGDLGLLAGLILLLVKTGSSGIEFLNTQAVGFLTPGELTAIVILLFIGVMGKSAQFPLHSWLPDAMEGPTPVSALIHSATMVAAGVYLLVRLFPLVSASASAMQFILWIGLFTSLITAIMALTERDMKRILAYSTISQLGFMVMIIGAGSWYGGMFHLLTHAFFKSMLFLLAGYFIAVSHHSNDIFEMAKVPQAHKSKLMVALLWIGALALSGLFPFSGFMSKESIFGALSESHQYVVYALALVISFLTAYYTTRMAFIISRKGGEAQGEAPVKDSWLFKAPVAFLGLVTVVGCWVFLPALSSFFHLHSEWHLEQWINFFVTTAVVLSAIGVSYLYFGRGGTNENGWVSYVPGLQKLITEKFYVDHFWRWVMDNIVYRIAKASFWTDDKIINPIVNNVGLSIIRFGKQAASLQMGQVQQYIATALLVVVVVAFYLIFSA